MNHTEIVHQSSINRLLIELGNVTLEGKIKECSGSDKLLVIVPEINESKSSLSYVVDYFSDYNIFTLDLTPFDKESKDFNGDLFRMIDLSIDLIEKDYFNTRYNKEINSRAFFGYGFGASIGLLGSSTKSAFSAFGLFNPVISSLTYSSGLPVDLFCDCKQPIKPFLLMKYLNEKLIFSKNNLGFDVNSPKINYLDIWKNNPEVLTYYKNWFQSNF